jgi:hypothetical protein
MKTSQVNNTRRTESLLWVYNITNRMKQSGAGFSAMKFVSMQFKMIEYLYISRHMVYSATGIRYSKMIDESGVWFLGWSPARCPDWLVFLSFKVQEHGWKLELKKWSFWVLEFWILSRVKNAPKLIPCSLDIIWIQHCHGLAPHNVGSTNSLQNLFTIF